MTAALYCIFFCLFVLAVVETVKESRISSAANAERARQRVAREQQVLAIGASALKALTVCPLCKKVDALNYWAQDGMEVRGHYCDHAWHLQSYLSWPDTTEMGSLSRAKIMDYARSHTR